MVQYITQSTFKHTLTQGSSTSNRGYPNEWQKPHWAGDNIYNQYLRVMLAEPDGTREYYDPVTGTHSYEHSSGYHKAILTDGVVENVPGKKVVFIGGGGLAETICGHHDHTVGGHTRMNHQGDVYHNVKGVAHYFHQQGAVHINMGNETHEHYGNVKHRVMGPGGWGVGIGPGDGNNHDNALTITNGRIYIRAQTNGDVWIQTASNNVNIMCGKTVNVTAQQDVNVLAPNGTITANSQTWVVNTTQNATVNAQANVSVTAQQSATVTATSGPLNLNGKPILLNGGGVVVPPLTIPG
jgi:hypothetical protein